MKKPCKPGIFNPKRKLRENFPEAVRVELAGKVSYRGNPEHKRNPGDFGLVPPSLSRPDKTLCDGCGIFRKAESMEAAQAQTARGKFDSGFCKVVQDWHKKGLGLGLAIPAWKQASLAAHALSDAMGMNGGPIQATVLATLFGISASQLFEVSVAPEAPLANAVAFTDLDSAAVGLFFARPRQTSRRFDLARIVGDQFVRQEGDRASIATEAKIYRQKFQRAFAQEFLCSWTALEERLGGSEPTNDFIEETAEHFEVSPLCVQTALVNHDKLPLKSLERFS